jgi:hypothetical protein
MDWKILDLHNIKVMSFRIMIYVNFHVIYEGIRNDEMRSSLVLNYPNIYEI